MSTAGAVVGSAVAISPAASPLFDRPHGLGRPTVKVAEKRVLSEEEAAEVREAFNLFDTDHSGFMDYRELKVALRALGFPVKKKDVKQILVEYDKDESGKIDLAEFQLIMTAKLLNRDPDEQMSKAFQLFDLDGSGKITVANLRLIARELGEEIDEQDLQGMIQEFDKDQDGKISEAEFCEIMRLNDS
ncbi:hypothetical protein WJX72_000983 [[Myrmecia] bisecta]|uniref:Caltractin n=1 Tax=[Myrmecia] bisecta TaxID=41462 RepID=A0AAW1QP31_9CHLO